MSYQEYTVRIYADHTEWLNKDGQRHRTDGPAVEWADGYKAWYQNGLRHRLDGPAIIEHGNGGVHHYLEGLAFTKADFDAEIARRNASVVSPCSLDGKLFTAEDGTKYKLSLVKE